MKHSSGESEKSAGLGPMLAEHPAGIRPVSRWIAGILGAILLLGGFFVLGFGFYTAYDAYYKHGPAVVWQTLLPPAGLGLMLLLIGGILFGRALIRKGKSLAIYDQGFVLRSRNTDESWRWDEVASIRTALTRRSIAGIHAGTRHTYTLVRRDGERIILDDSLAGVEVLADKIRDKVLPMLYARFAPSLASGQELAFGPVQICRDKGIQVRQKKLAWKVVRQAKVENGVLTITAGDEQKTLHRVKIPVAEVPNVDILLAIIQQMIDCGPTPGNTSTAGD